MLEYIRSEFRIEDPTTIVVFGLSIGVTQRVTETHNRSGVTETGGGKYRTEDGYTKWFKI